MNMRMYALVLVLVFSIYAEPSLGQHVAQRRPYFPTLIEIRTQGSDSFVLADWTDQSDPTVSKELPRDFDLSDFEKKFPSFIEKLTGKKPRLITTRKNGSKLIYKIPEIIVPTVNAQSLKIEGPRPYPQNIVQTIFMIQTDPTQTAEVNNRIQEEFASLVADTFTFSQYVDQIDKENTEIKDKKFSVTRNFTSLPSQKNANLLIITLSFTESKTSIKNESSSGKNVYIKNFASIEVIDGREVITVIQKIGEEN